MAQANEIEDTAEQGEARKSGGIKRLLILSLILVLLIGGGLGAWFYLQGGKDAGAQPDAAEAPKEEKHVEPIYVLLGEPGKPFLANLAETSEADFLQVEVQVTITDPKLESKIKTHMPALRGALLTLFSQQKSTELKTHEGREALRQQALAEVRRVLEKQAGVDPQAIQDLLFTSFLMQ